MTNDDTIPGITTTIASEITDYEALGRHLANANCEEQVAFLAGLATGFQGFGPVRPNRFLGLMQMEYIREKAEEHKDPAEIRWLIKELNERLNAEDAVR